MFVFLPVALCFQLKVIFFSSIFADKFLLEQKFTICCGETTLEKQQNLQAMGGGMAFIF